MDWNLSVWDVLDIFKNEDRSYCLCWNSEKQRIEGIHLMSDFINLLLNLDLTHFFASKKFRLVYILENSIR